MSFPENSISQWLDKHGLTELAPAFVEHRVALDVLPTLTGDDLREMGVTALGNRKRLMAAIAMLNAPGVLQIPCGAERRAVQEHRMTEGPPTELGEIYRVG